MCVRVAQTRVPDEATSHLAYRSHTLFGGAFVCCEFPSDLYVWGGRENEKRDLLRQEHTYEEERVPASWTG